MAKTVLTEYNLNMGLGIRIAHVSDLHEKDGTAALELLKSASPDVIFSTGDMLNRKEEGAVMANGETSTYTLDVMRKWQGVKKNALKDFIRNVLYFKGKKRIDNSKNTYDFFSAASEIAPVYISTGNHEWYYEKRDIDFFAEKGITLLDNVDVEINLKGKRLLVGGLSPRYDLDWLSGFSKKDATKILLMHNPEYYERYVMGERDKFGLILSGHAHGGQWQFFGHAAVAPGQGLNPKYYHGLYDTESGVMEVSAGMANTVSAPRFNNPCEVVIINT